MTIVQEKMILLRGIKTLQRELHALKQRNPDNMIEFMDLHGRYMNLVECLLNLEFLIDGQRESDRQ